MTNIDDNQAFYVPYLALPAGLIRPLVGIVLTLLATMGGVAFLISRSQGNPGSAAWNDSIARDFRGTLVVWPYPMLILGDGSGMALLVETGKHGVARDVSSLVGRPVLVTGWTLDRDGKRMIELVPEERSLRADESGALMDMPHARRLGAATLRGEIVDSKCFLGAMKPGEGKTHKACATLCIRGGIPPILISRGEGQAIEYTLLCDADGRPLGAEIWPLVAEPVEAAGELEEMGGFRRLRIAPGGLRPL